MDKLDMQTRNIADENYAALAKLFPNALTETVVGYDEEGKAIVERAIDADVLRQEISCSVVEGREERYQFTWPDKKKAMLLANAPVSLTLRPCKEESVDFDNTENLYIEGDNLDVLKLLQETYLGKIKMIYIDPPYNTGNDFIYEDDFSENTDEYLSNSGQYDDLGNRLVQNTEGNGRFHTDWLNMIYPRIKLAKNLLTEEGIIFISINDAEEENIKKICNEIFGEENYISTFIWNTEGHTDNQFVVKVNHEYIVAYAKNIKKVALGWVIDPNTRQESNLWKGFAENSITKNGAKNPPIKVTLKKGFPCKVESLMLSSNNPSEGFWSELSEIGYITRQMTEKYNVQYPIRLSDMKVKNGVLSEDVEVFSGWANSNKLKDFMKNGFKPLEEVDGKISFYLSENGVIYYFKERSKARNIVSVLRNFGTTEQMRSELEKDNVIFSYPKPISLLEYILRIGSDKEDDYILDFFSGSATTAHAVMKMNATDGGKRKYIMVQLPEKIDTASEAYKQGYSNICEIGRKRITASASRVHDEYSEAKFDSGFRVLKLDSSNMKDVYYNPSQMEQQSLFASTDNIKEDRTPEDLLFQVMLDLGVLLSSKIEEKVIAGKKVFNVADGFLIACFDSDVTEETVKAVAQEKPYYAVFRDSSMANDSVATNFEQIFATYSPETVRKVL